MTVQLAHPATENCRALRSILALVADKWTVLIVVLLGDGPKRFNEIKRMVGGISQRMLTFTLRGLERDGLVTRTVFPTTPQRVDYELTKLGSTLWKAVEPLSSWARAHVLGWNDEGELPDPVATDALGERDRAGHWAADARTGAGGVQHDDLARLARCQIGGEQESRYTEHTESERKADQSLSSTILHQTVSSFVGTQL